MESGLFSEYPLNWKWCTLGEVVTCSGGFIQTGPFGSQLHASDYVMNGVPFIMPVNIGENRLNEHNIARITEDDAERLSRHKVKAGDIIYSRRGDVEKRALVRAAHEGWICGSGCLLVRSGDNIVDPIYLSYYLGHPTVREWIVRHAVGATMPNLNTGIMAALPLLIAPLPEQRAIASILGALDDKIELNRRMNATLEAMARAIFQSWFVDFDPVRAKAEGRETGLPAEIAALFPDAFVESELGEIPIGWQMAPIMEHFEAVKGVSYKGSGLSGSGIPLHNLNSVYEGGGYKFEGIKYYNGDYAERHIVKPGDLIVANTEQGHDRLLIGYSAIVPYWFGQLGIASHHIFRLRPKPGTPATNWFLCHMLNSQQMHAIVSGYANGTTVNMLPITGVQYPLFTIPPAELIAIFDHLAENVAHKSEAARAESRNLTTLRDTLLPKLISGQLRVPEAEKLIEEATA
jgi:type I restriction enzyme S subunit